MDIFLIILGGLAVLLLFLWKLGQPDTNYINEEKEFLTRKLSNLKAKKQADFSAFISQAPTDIEPKTDETIMLIDFETTGLPIDFDAPISHHSNWPRIVSASLLLYNLDRKLIRSFYCLVKQNESIPEEATVIHKITTQQANSEGIPIDELLLKVREFAKRSKFVVAHNLDFDLKVLLSEISRLNQKSPFSRHRKICTMKSGKKFCDIPNYNYRGLKYPKLSELVAACFDIDTGTLQLHDAVIDSKLAGACFFYLWDIENIDLKLTSR